jgi:light-regulated signal transduction histidine kinase (bacteriophytochrome)
MYNKLLQKQLRKALGDVDNLPEQYQALFTTVSQSYDFYEKDRSMMERSMELSSDEMIGLYKQLKNDTDATLKQSAADLELKNAELEIKNKELEIKNRELEQFAYVASHDLQEPLRTTSSFAELLQRQYAEKLDEKAIKYLTFITQSSDRMKVLIKDLLDYSRIGRQKQVQEVDCNRVLAHVLEDLNKSITDEDAIIEAGQMPLVSGYASEIQQVFQNLVINAIKFRKKDTIPEVMISARPLKGYWEFAIKDNGIGMDEKHSERIFIIFQRLHNRGEYKGSGIGLAHCKKIVELHGGRIWVKSAPGQGCTFYFTLPSKQANQPVPSNDLHEVEGNSPMLSYQQVR